MRSHGWRWVLLAALLGFLSSFVFADILRLPRAAFVAAHAALTALLIVTYVRIERLNVRWQLERRWIAGLVAGIIFGVLLIWQVLGQPPSPRPQGIALVGQLAWYGIVYGSVDALLLSVVPVLALYGMRGSSGLQEAADRLRWALIALFGSALVTAAYHAGFSEFRGAQLMQPVIGNTMITLTYLLTGNPLAPIVAHVLMHAAAVIHGADATIQLSPHY